MRWQEYSAQLCVCNGGWEELVLPAAVHRLAEEELHQRWGPSRDMRGKGSATHWQIHRLLKDRSTGKLEDRKPDQGRGSKCESLQEGGVFVWGSRQMGRLKWERCPQEGVSR